ncbi:MAG: DUF1648 domain-containing protein [Candidatus Gracilibacteria bacterium]|nr:DUF1648 domain-containing protein [Candidatus Gracilibacteria bacterium]
MKKIKLIQIGIIVLSFIIPIFLYSKLPEHMASHWDMNGKVNGYMPKFWGIFIMPIISMTIYLLLTYLPKIDPMKENIKTFGTYYDTFITVFLGFFLYISLIVLSWNLGYKFDMNLMIIPSISVLFYFVGELLINSKRNWFIGIRTPWTLSNDIVWEKTNKLGGKIFKIIALIFLLAIFTGINIFYVIVVPILASVIFLLVYSYLEYKKINKN